MTFKHIKFQDSPVMQSLERQIISKKPQTDYVLAKTASKKNDFSPSSSLVENILNLCAGLKQAGFGKYANELEEKFVLYKQAQTLYETTKEEGKDLIDFAHPKGSHKLEDVDNEMATFHTILDQQLAAVKMVNKKPLGKLSSSKDIIHAVKIVLADEDGVEGLTKKMEQNLNEVNTILNKLSQVVDGSDYFGFMEKSNYKNSVSFIELFSKEPMVKGNIQGIFSMLLRIRQILHPDNAGYSDDKLWSSINNFLVAAQLYTSNASVFYNQIMKINSNNDKINSEKQFNELMNNKPAEDVEKPKPTFVKSFYDLFEKTTNKMNALNAVVQNAPDDKRKQNAILWLKDRDGRLGKLKDTVDKSQTNSDKGNSVAEAMLNILTPLSNEILGQSSK